MLERLSARQCQTAKAKKGRPTLHSDGGGLYLRVASSGAKSWLFRYQAGRKQTDMGLGPYPDVGLAKARLLAAAQRELRRDGVDPLAHKRAQRDAAALAAAKAVSFAECNDAYLRAHAGAWKGDANLKQWRASIETYATPVIGKLPVAAIDTGLVLRVIEPIWEAKRVTADRVRRRIESVLDFAVVNSWRPAGDNPARWAGHLEHRLASVAAKPVEHYAALPYTQLPEFMAILEADHAVSNDPRSPEERRRATNALAFLVLTAARTDEVLGMTWAEVDLPNRLWVVPAERMKAGREHRVPLSDAATALLGEPGKSDDFVFASPKGLKPYRHLFRNELHRLGYEVTAHGFRSSFRDWAAERGVDHTLAEMALGHAVGTAVERAYRRTTMFEKRRQLAQQWARHCSTPSVTGGAKVVKLSR